MTTEYAFDTASAPGHVQVHCLSEMLDGTSTRLFDHLGVQPGERCIDLGAGNGSIARWLAYRVGPTGSVAAVDIDPDHIDTSAGITAYNHDINNGLPVPGPFDIVHARLLLMHLSRRREILDRLVSSLAPGGRLVVCDVSERAPRAVTANDRADRELFDRFFDIVMRRVASAVGMELRWAHEVSHLMADAGLTDVHSFEYAFTASGGEPGLQYYNSLLQQVGPVLSSVGIGADEQARLRELMLDPDFGAWSYQFVFTSGRRPD